MSEDIISPDGRYNVSFSSYEVRMSHWIDQPYLIRVSDDVCLFALNDGGWSAWAVRWLDDSTVEFVMRKYPGQPECTVTLNLSTNQATAKSRADSIVGTFPAVKDWVLALEEPVLVVTKADRAKSAFRVIARLCFSPFK